MDDATVQLILGRFDKVDEKLDAQSKEISTLASRVTALETKVETQVNPLVSEATFQRRTRYVGHVLSGSIGAGIIAAWQWLFPHARLK